ncbi:MAG: hypothetical protein GY884_08035, partial [Proteobacteria bacterium]|nr:hypothetical protein [Pseudomonadota bacterium]
LNAAASEMRDGQLWLRYDFKDEAQLEDWLKDETHLPWVRMRGVLKTPEKDHRMEVANGGLELLGVQGLRYILPYKGAMRVRYGLQLPEVGEEDDLWKILFYLHDDLDVNRFVVHNLGYTIELLERDYPTEVEREEQHYEVGRDYFVEAVVDRKNDLTVRREDLSEDFNLSMPSQIVKRGHIRLATLTDHLTRLTTFDIQGTPDMVQLDLFMGAYVDKRLDQLGF